MVTGVVAVRLVEEPEVVDVDEGDADRRSVGAGVLEGGPKPDDERAVVEQAGERIALGRVEQLLGLFGDPALRGSEGEVQDRAGDEGRGERDDQHVALDVGDRGEDRRGVAPHADDRPCLAGLVQQREQGAQHLASVAGGVSRIPPWALPSAAAAKVGASGSAIAGSTGDAGRAGQTGPCRCVANLQAAHPGVPCERREQPVEPLHASRIGGLREVARREPVVHERPDDGRVAGHGRVDRRGREVQRHERRLDRGRDADHDEEHAVDDQTGERGGPGEGRDRTIERLLGRIGLRA